MVRAAGHSKDGRLRQIDAEPAPVDTPASTAPHEQRTAWQEPIQGQAPRLPLYWFLRQGNATRLNENLVAGRKRVRRVDCRSCLYAKLGNPSSDRRQLSLIWSQRSSRVLE